jgi:hypothetical protein
LLSFPMNVQQYLINQCFNMAEHGHYKLTPY